MRSLDLATCALLAFCIESAAQGRAHPIIELRLARAHAAPGYAPRQLEDTTFYVSDGIIVSDPDIEQAGADWWEGGLVIHVRMTTQAAKRLEDATKNHIQDRIAMFLDGQLMGAPTIAMGISGPTLQLDIGPPAPVDRIAAEISARWPTPQ